MTGSYSDSSAENSTLPLWRTITGFAVLGILVVLLAIAGLVYVDNFRLDRYMNDLAAQPASAGLSDSVLTARLLERAGQLGLSVQASDVSVTRPNGKLIVRIAKYTVQTPFVRMDLRLPEATSH